MKKTYNSPAIEYQQFQIVDVLGASTGDNLFNADDIFVWRENK